MIAMTPVLFVDQLANSSTAMIDTLNDTAFLDVLHGFAPLTSLPPDEALDPSTCYRVDVLILSGGAFQDNAFQGNAFQ